MKFFQANRRRGFAAIELAVVIGGVATLGLFLPALGTAKAKANRIKCANNLKQIYMSHLSFAQDNRERMPWQLLARGHQAHAGPNAINDPTWSTDIERIWSCRALKFELQSPKILHSPCDPGAAAHNEIIQENWGAYDLRQNRNLPRQGLSYALHLGADTQRAATILALTRNFDGDDAPLFQHPGLPGTKPHRVPHGRSLRVNSPNATFIGADQFSNSRVMAGLNQSQGQLILMEGSAWQADDGHLQRHLRAHKNTRGGTTPGDAYEGITRPRQ